ncbi:MAG: CtsR family transcriptional regulator [Firmicutes bacterium]|nr:CtsR family transcriptional regulator [Bacillota bacterium]
MGISDKIEAFINELMKEDEEYVELGRNELADIFNCVPSQINYVISTRFSPQRGYIVESKRGGGGYIKIKKIYNDVVADVISRIGDSCDFETAKAIITSMYKDKNIEQQAAKVLLAAVSDKALDMRNPQRDKSRAAIMKNALAAIK